MERSTILSRRFGFYWSRSSHFRLVGPMHFGGEEKTPTSVFAATVAMTSARRRIGVQSAEKWSKKLFNFKSTQDPKFGKIVEKTI
jgi:hypothetical protein